MVSEVFILLSVGYDSDVVEGVYSNIELAKLESVRLYLADNFIDEFSIQSRGIDSTILRSCVTYKVTNEMVEAYVNLGL